MNTTERRAKSSRARHRRKSIKEIKALVLRHTYAHLHRLKMKYKAIQSRHHDE